MNFSLRSSALAVTTGAMLATVALPAEANTVHRGGHIAGYEVDLIIESPNMWTPDRIFVYGPRGKEEIEVTCRPFDWTAWGPNSEAFIDEVAARWCFG